MAWSFDAGGNDGINDTRNILKADGDRHGVLFLPIKALAVANGWAVVASGDGASLFEWDGVTAGNGTGSGGKADVWTSHGTGTGTAGDVSNQLAWCVLEDPAGNQLFLQGTSSAGIGWDCYGSVYYLPGGGYSSTGINATTGPAAASGEIRLRGARGGAGANLIGYIGSSKFWIAFDDEERAGTHRWFWAVWEASVQPYDVLGVMTLGDPNENETAPWFILGGGTSGSGGPSGTSVFSIWEVQSEGLGAERNYTSTSFDSACLTFDVGSGNGADDPWTGQSIMYNLPYIRQFGSANDEYVAGIMEEIYTRSDLSVDYPDYFDHNGLRYVHFGDIALPWGYTDDSPPDPEDTTSSGSDSGVRVVEFGVVSAGGAADVTPPVVTFGVPPGTTIARNQALPVDVEEETAIRASVILVEFPSQGVYEVAWDSEGFAPRYADSERTAISGGFRYTLRRSGGWFSTPTIRALAIDTAGNAAA